MTSQHASSIPVADPSIRLDDLQRPKSELVQELTALRERLSARAVPDALPAHTRGPSAALYENLVQHGLGLIYSHDLEGAILSINEAAASMLDFGPRELVGVRLVELIAPDFRPFFPEHLDRVRQNRADQGMMRLLTKGGEEREWTYRCVMMTAVDGAPYVLGHAHDLTALLQARRDLRRVRNELETSVRRHASELADSHQQFHREAEQRRAVEQALAFANRRSRMLTRLAAGAVEDTSTGGMLRRAVRHCTECFPGAQVAYLTPDRNVLVAAHVAPRQTAPWHAREHGPITWPREFIDRLRTSAPLAIGDVVFDADVGDAAGGPSSVAVLATPLRPNRDLAGVFCVQALAPRSWEGYEVDTIKEVAAFVSSVLAHEGRGERIN